MTPKSNNYVTPYVEFNTFLPYSLRTAVRSFVVSKKIATK